MFYYLGGKFLTESEALVSIMDRGFLYGDGLFETLRAWNFSLPLWEHHLERFQAGAAFLGIRSPVENTALLEACVELLKRNQMPEAILRITLTRGIGMRGYSPKGADHPTLAITIHPVVPPKPCFRAIISKFVLPSDDPIAAFKTCNKIRQILARTEADLAGADEAILLNENGWVVEGSSTNLFWFEDDSLCTPPCNSGILPGVTRNILFDLASELGWSVHEKNVGGAEMKNVGGLLLTASTFGCMPVESLDGVPLKLHRFTSLLQKAWEDRMKMLAG